jgi:uncharacterized protein
MTSTAAAASTPNDRWTRLEDPGTEFPFHNGVPVAVSGRQWLFVMAAVALGFVPLLLPIHWPGGPIGPFIPAVLLPLIPLMALARVAPGHWQAIFGRVGWRELRLMVGFALLNIVVSMAVGVIVNALTTVSSNAAASELAGMDGTGRALFFAKTVPQLLGEEVITLLPFLALLHWLTARVGMGRRGAIIAAWLITSAVFGLIHLPTYDWNLVQCLVVIGSARLVLTLPWILTKNLWVSTGAHILNDWMLFGMGLLGAGLAGKV